jgi:broad specificity phosphatase PhoE
MKVYFVRHAESHNNVAHVHDNPEVGLTETGMMQARTVAKRFKKIEIDAIVSSHYLRAEQTARVINKITKKEIVFTELLKEAVIPSEIVGKKIDSAEVLLIRAQMREHRNDPDWHYSDEENFFDVRNRAMRALEYIKRVECERVLVVTHGTFLRMLIGVMMLGDRLVPDMHLDISHFLTTNNTGITVCEVSDSGAWKLVTWNDHAHLG